MTVVLPENGLFFSGIRKGRQAKVRLALQTSHQSTSLLWLPAPLSIPRGFQFRGTRFLCQRRARKRQEKQKLADSAPFIRQTTAFQRLDLRHLVYILLFKTIT